MQLINYTQVGERARNVVVVLQFAAVALKYTSPINRAAVSITVSTENRINAIFLRSPMSRSCKRRLNITRERDGDGARRDRLYLKTNHNIKIPIIFRIEKFKKLKIKNKPKTGGKIIDFIRAFNTQIITQGARIFDVIFWHRFMIFNVNPKTAQRRASVRLYYLKVQFPQFQISPRFFGHVPAVRPES